jgi:hypothetical protein
MSRSRIALLVWLMLWMTVIPFVHSHTGVHGLDTHPHHQHGLIHTVFSADSDLENHRHQHIGPSSVTHDDLLSEGLIEDEPQVQELEVSFLVTPDRKPQQSVSLVTCSDDTVVLPHDVSMRGPPADTAPHLLLCVFDNRSPRAPPVCFASLIPNISTVI